MASAKSMEGNGSHALTGRPEMTIIGHMKTAEVAELKARLASYLKTVKSGGEVLITDRGVPVAKLVPLDREKKRKTRRRRLAAAGSLTLGRGRVPKELLKPPSGDRRAGGGVLEALLAEREEGR